MKKAVCLLLAVALLFATTACSHEHEYAEATCTEPETCTICGETKGEALGHTVDIGACTRCKEMVNRDDIEKLVIHIFTLNDYLSSFSDYIGKSNDSSYIQDRVRYCKKAADYLKKNQDELKEIAKITAKYDEFYTLNSYLKPVISMDITGPTGTDLSEVRDYLDVALDYVDKYGKAYEELKSWSEKMNSVLNGSKSPNSAGDTTLKNIRGEN